MAGAARFEWQSVSERKAQRQAWAMPPQAHGPRPCEAVRSERREPPQADRAGKRNAPSRSRLRPDLRLTAAEATATRITLNLRRPFSVQERPYQW
jgi:hypothetical protein